MNREQIRNQINGRPLTDFVALERPRGAARDMYVCPVCRAGSGNNGNKTAGLKLYRDTNRVICFPGHCFTEKGEDTTGALRIIWECDETEVFRRAGYSLDDSAEPQPKHKEHTEHKEQQEHKPAADYTAFYQEAHEALLNSPEALEYLHGRGITDDSIQRFNLGYSAAWKHSATLENEKKYNKTFPGTKRIIIPRTKRTYTARRIDKPQNATEANYIKQIQGTQKDLFNLEALEAGETPFIVEGELDAISLLQAGAASVVGIGSTVNAAEGGPLLEAMKKHPEKVYIIALDNDPPKEDGTKPGEEAQKELVQAMQKAGLYAMPIEPDIMYLGAKDGNEAFLKHPDELKALIAAFEDSAQQLKAMYEEEQREELEKRTGTGMTDSFLQTIKSRDFEPIPTGIKDIDRATAGGFTRKTLVLISGAPGLGKTALAQAITENIAQAGRDVLFINLEMDRNQLLARSFARIAWTEARGDLSPLEVLRGYSWTEEQEAHVMNAKRVYDRDIAPRFVYNPDGVTNDINSIFQAMEAETTRIKAQGRPEPIICIDYLQLIDSGAGDAVQGLKETIYRLKAFAKEHNTVVIAISATNRAANKAGTVDLESGRDTSAVEYSGDMMLGLSYAAIEDRRKVTYEFTDEDGIRKPETKECDLEFMRRIRREAYDRGENPPAVCNEVSLKVLKNRFGEPERRAKLIFDGRHNLFTMAAHGFQEAQEYRGKDWPTITRPGREQNGY